MDHTIRRGRTVFMARGVLAITVTTLVALMLVVVAMIDLDARSLSYPSTRPALAVFDFMVGLVLFGASWATIAYKPFGVPAAVIPALAVCWLAADFVGWLDGSEVVRSTAMLVAPLSLALVVHLAVAFAGVGHSTARLGLAFVVGSYVVVIGFALAIASLRDPFLDVDCWDNCTDNVFVIAAHRAAAETLTWWWRAVRITIGALLVGWCTWRLWAATSVGRQHLGAVLGPAMAVGATEALHATALLAGSDEDPRSTLYVSIFLARGAALLAVGAGVIWAAVRSHRLSQSLERLAMTLDPSVTGSLQDTLRRALADDTIEVSYWFSPPGRFVDATGTPVPDNPATNRTTAIVRGDELVAVVRHADTTQHVEPVLQHHIGASARLAVDNERLRAELLARTDELRASRARIVAAGDETRRRVERDLHDGVQQGLLALSYEVRLAAADARNADQTELVEALECVLAEVQLAIDHIRHLARGIYPSILNDAGLSAAVRALAEDSPLPVTVEADVGPRCDRGAELAAYLAVVELVGLAARRRATGAGVRLRHADGEVIATVRHDGSDGAADDLVRIRDRVGAIGGRVLVDHSQVSVVVPCASS